MKSVAALLWVLALVVAGTGWAADRLESADRPDVEVIDIPTAEVLDHYGYRASFRFGREGAVQIKPTFGVFPRLNLGFGLDTERLIGTEDARMNRPTLSVKFRAFDGAGILPAIAIGFDGQGYVWNKELDEYEQREMGFYLVGTSEFLLNNLYLHYGANIYDFDHGDPVRGFLGASYTYRQVIGLMAEWVSATEYKERRINYGLKYFVTPTFTVDLAGRNIAEEPGSEGRITERIVKLNYVGSF